MEIKARFLVYRVVKTPGDTLLLDRACAALGGVSPREGVWIIKKRGYKSAATLELALRNIVYAAV
jgi:hypothetical protein